MSAVGSAGFSVLAGLLYGERPTALALAGIVLALPAIVGVSVSAGEGPAPDGAGRGFRLPGARARLLAVITGVAGEAGAILFFFATHQGFLAVTAVLTSLYPAVTIVLARTIPGERLTALRLAGLGLAGVCVSLIAAGGAS